MSQSPGPPPIPGPVPPPPNWGPAPPAPPKKRRTGLVIALVAGGVLLILCLCGGLFAVLSDGDEAPSGTEANQDTTKAPEQPKTGAGAPKLGQPVRDGKFEFVVKNVKCGVRTVGDEFFNKKAQGQFCLVTLTVQNIGDESQTFNDFDQRGHDSKGQEYKPDSEAGIYANENNEVWLTEINPGNKITGVLIFDIPEKTKLTSLELHDSGFSGGVEVSL